MPDAETQLTDEQLKEQLEKGEETPASKPEAIEFKTETGQVYKGKDWEEIAQQIARSQEHATRTIKEQRDEREYLMQQIRERQQETPLEKKQAKSFDKVKFYETWGTDPLEAEREIIRRVVAEEFGVESFDEIKDSFQFAYNKTLGIHQNEELFKFFGEHPEYQGTPEEAEKITNWLDKNGYQVDPSRRKFITARDFEYAYYKLIEQGEIKVPEQQEEQIVRPSAPPPTLSGTGGGTGPSIEEKAKNMSDKELEEFLRKQGILKY